MMTIVVALANSDISFMVGDTLLTPLIDVKGNPVGPVNGEFHGLKIHVLDGRTAVAFATSNAATAAIKIIAEAKGELQKNPSADIFSSVFEIYRRALDSCVDEKPDCEFLVLKLDAGGNRLAQITGVGIKFCERAYVGDSDQYAKMTTLRTPYESPKHTGVQQPDGSLKTSETNDSKGEIEFSEVSIALEKLVQQRRKEGVGAVAGNVIRVAGTRHSGELEYLQMHEAGISPEEGQVGFSHLASNSKTRGIGIYYIAGKTGFLLIAGDIETCRKESAETIEEFKVTAQQKFGLELA